MAEDRHLFEMRSVGGDLAVIAAGPMMRSVDGLTFRIELCERHGRYLVCFHYVDIPPNGCPIHREYRVNFDFVQEKLVDAIKCFAIVIKANAGAAPRFLAERRRSKADEDTAVWEPDTRSV